MAAGTSIEILKTGNPSATTAINLSGNEIANTLYGNAGSNVLNGGGDTDIMYGGAGSDTYVIDVQGDQAVENSNEGIDTVLSSISARPQGAHRQEEVQGQMIGDESRPISRSGRLRSARSSRSPDRGLGGALR